MTSIVSIDWGGTNLRAVCLRPELDMLLYNAPAANIRLLKKEKLRQIIRNMVAEMKLSAIAPDFLLVGAAGAGDQTAVENLKNEIYNQLPSLKVCEIYPDYKCNHAAALGGESGILSINGTGSLLYYNNYNCDKRLGGWGYLFDNAPSGASFGRMVLKSALEYTEGDSSKKNIFNKLNHEYALKDATTILDEIYQSANQQNYLGQFANILTSCFDENVLEAKKLVKNSIGQMKKRLSCMLESISDTRPVLSGIGGLWENWPEFAKIMDNMMKEDFPKISLKKPIYKNIFGPLIYQSKSCDECRHIFSLIPEKDKLNQ